MSPEEIRYLIGIVAWGTEFALGVNVASTHIVPRSLTGILLTALFRLPAQAAQADKQAEWQALSQMKLKAAADAAAAAQALATKTLLSTKTNRTKDKARGIRPSIKKSGGKRA